MVDKGPTVTLPSAGSTLVEDALCISAKEILVIPVEPEKYGFVWKDFS